MERDFQAKLDAMKAEADAHKSSEQEAQEAAERQARLEAEMKFKLEQQRLDQEKEAAEREERIRREEAQIKRRQLEFSALEAKLGTVLPLVNEANLISQELDRNVRFNVKMVRDMPEFGGEMAESTTNVMIRVDNKETGVGYYYMWDAEKFENRLPMMRECLNEFFDTEKKPDFSDKEKDPWYDHIEPLQIGTSYLSLKSLCFGMGSDMDCKILSSEGKGGTRGQLKVKYDVMKKEGANWVIDEDGEQYEDIEVP